MQNSFLDYKNVSDQSWPCIEHVGKDESNRLQRHRVRGNDALEQELRDAKSQGYLFARKFKASHPDWVNWIRLNLHRE